ncbi:MAG: hypothetical protein ACFFER_19475 [Candidatus Thorarchaeota archaeon]
MHELYLQEFQESIENIRKKSFDSQGLIKTNWGTIRQLWSSHYSQIPDDLINQRTRLLIAVRYTECLQSILWIEWLVMHGGYHQAIRELRSILESIVQAYYVDKNYRDIDVKGKLAVLKEMNLSRSDFGKKLIEKANPPSSHKTRKLYDELSKFVHTSVEHLDEILSEPDSDQRIVELTTPQYDRKLLQKCYKLTEQVVKHVIAMNQDLIEKLIP